ncbi:MAG: hypothetical protein ACYS9Y_11440 [Planctomycetota bacterium]|jgi:DNA-binding transcriptional regulator GbsR (MarR family)
MLIDNLAKSNHLSRSAVSAVMIVISAIAMYNWIVAPRAAYLRAVQRHEIVAGNIAQKNEVINKKVVAKRKKLQKLQEQFTKLRDTLFTPEQAKEFFSDLQTISEEVGCAVYSLNILTTEPSRERRQSQDGSYIVPKSATLTVAGVYEKIIRLLERLQVRTQKVWVDSIKMEIFDYDSAKPKCNITITIYTVEEEEAAV